MINRTSIVSKDETQFLASELGDEIVMMNLENGNFIGLNEVGSAIMKLIDRPISVSEIISELLKEYAIDQATCETDVLEYITVLTEKNILNIA